MKHDLHSKLLEKTRLLLEKDERQDYVLAVELGVSPGAIKNIRKGKVDSPGVLLVESLYNLLSNKKLQL